ncbi:MULTISPECIES: hypothetical protein [Streptomyces]|uniref:Uncharacterized protein n=1 Tax=Streptomyces spororaveus TaxID=284039 RepID=A0ABQ3TH34_9ACTN|nr:MULTISPECIES: hypothetical protein [Streptomyces]MCM9079947.1 hypothetical protein [Streptomyces spororaveus]MCX5305638.1 hypothetical protein [Streptomyces sp. NBC_00160]GHI79709.1 hypothetical protein Sspor_52700 [Streptomyces spororaveus]
MRPSARIPSILAGLALAVGGAVVVAPSAHADVLACEQYVAKHDSKVKDGVAEACYQGAIGNQTSCDSSLVAAGASKDVAQSACEASR